MKLIKLSKIITSLILISGISIAQPLFTFHITGGYSIPMGIFTGSIEKTDTVPSNWPYLMNNGYNFGADAKFALGKNKNFRITAGVNYTMFHNKGDVVKSGDTTLICEFKPSINILTLSFGAEYAFTPKEKSSPFFGIDVTGNFFTGDFTFTPPLPGNAITSLKPETRIGLQFNGGVDVAFSKNIGAVFGLKFNWTNLFKKGSDNAATKITEIGLGDEQHVENGTTVAAKNITYFQPYAGFTFVFGQPKKKMKK